MRLPPRRARALAFGLAVVCAGCTSSASRPAATSAPPRTFSSPERAPAPVSPPSRVPVRTPAARPRSTPPPPSAAPSSTAPPAAAPAPLRSTCRHVTVRVIRGSGGLGEEFAALQFTNDGTAPCVLYGYPSATLLRKGQVIGSVSRPASGATSARTLAPGDTAESRLEDFTGCQAPLSDSVRVVVPGSSRVRVRPAQLRACRLRVGRLSAPE